jgi:hypothetical protein
MGVFNRDNPILSTFQKFQNVKNSKSNQTVTEHRVNSISTRTILTLYGRDVCVLYKDSVRTAL